MEAYTTGIVVRSPMPIDLEHLGIYKDSCTTPVAPGTRQYLQGLIMYILSEMNYVLIYIKSFLFNIIKTCFPRTPSIGLTRPALDSSATSITRL